MMQPFKIEVRRTGMPRPFLQYLPCHISFSTGVTMSWARCWWMSNFIGDNFFSFFVSFNKWVPSRPPAL